MSAFFDTSSNKRTRRTNTNGHRRLSIFLLDGVRHKLRTVYAPWVDESDALTLFLACPTRSKLRKNVDHNLYRLVGSGPH